MGELDAFSATGECLVKTEVDAPMSNSTNDSSPCQLELRTENNSNSSSDCSPAAVASACALDTPDDAGAEFERLMTSPYVEFDADGLPADRPPPARAYSERNPRVRTRMLTFLDHIRATWTRAVAKMCVDKEFLEALRSLHLGYASRMTKALLKRHMITIARVFKDYAAQQPEFSALSRLDQRKLLCRNTPLFIQYLLGRYLTAPTAEDQLHWILACQVPADLRASAPVMRRVKTDVLDANLNLFDPSAAVEEYVQFANALNKPILLLRCNCLVALAVLYRTDFNTVMDEPNLVSGHLDNIYTFAEWAHEVFHCASKLDLDGVGLSLDGMSAFFETNVRWDAQASFASELSREVTLLHTVEEDGWVDSQFDVFQREYGGVSLGDEVLNDWIMFSFDVPLSKKMAFNVVGCFAERCRRLLMAHEEVRRLPNEAMAGLFHANVFDGIGVLITKLDRTEDPYVQLRFLLGDLDCRIYKSRYGRVLENKRLKRIHNKHVNDTIQLMDDNSRCKEMEERMTVIHAVVRDVELLQLFVLCSLLQPPADMPADAAGPIAALQGRYLACLRRKMAARDMGERFGPLMTEIRGLAKIMKMIHAQYNSETA